MDKKNIIFNLNIESKKRLIELFANRIADTYPEVSVDLAGLSICKRD
ncbi:PTS sugar transporter subunit IIA, partial [Francisella tularensis subsp. holarctica]|nr:PTS sugar transporter subunit IIA [Francisella tularensis subsp. holarctica]